MTPKQQDNTGSIGVIIISFDPIAPMDKPYGYAIILNENLDFLDSLSFPNDNGKTLSAAILTYFKKITDPTYYTDKVNIAKVQIKNSNKIKDIDVVFPNNNVDISKNAMIRTFDMFRKLTFEL